MAELGRIILILTLAAAVLTVVIAALAASGKSARWTKGARRGIYATGALYTLALVVLLAAFVTRDFSLRIVAEHVNLDMPAIYSLSALYADKAGSLFLWGWLTAICGVVFAWRRAAATSPANDTATLVMALVVGFFLWLTVVVSNVFASSPQIVADGWGLNPLLRNFGMLVHPPLLYISFAAVAVVFALTVAALAKRQPVREWGNQVRRWAVFAWVMLGLGNVVGMWWSYNELGWGGYWAWDPVENAGLMPWLTATALLHALAMLRRRNYMRVWSPVMAILTFVFTLLIPFITHGGVESPLHGFQGSPFPGFILAAIIISLSVSIWLLWLRRADLKGKPVTVAFFSREGFFLITNIILMLTLFFIFAGTVLPTVVALFGNLSIAIDRSFYDSVCGPLLLLLVFLMGVCPMLVWGKPKIQALRRDLVYPLGTIAVIALIAGFVFDFWTAMILLVCLFPLYIIKADVWRAAAALSRSRGINWFKAGFQVMAGNRARYGGFIVHAGIILMALGIIGSSFFDAEAFQTMNVGDTIEVGGHTLSYEALNFTHDDEMVRAVADVSVSRDGRDLVVLQPEYNYWHVYNDFFAEAAVRSTAGSDLFVSMVWTSFQPDDQSATFKILYSPLVVWIWIGGVLLLLGGAFAFTARKETVETES